MQEYSTADDVTVLLLCCWSLMLVEGVAVAGRNDVQILGSRGTREKIYFCCPKKKKFVIFRFFGRPGLLLAQFRLDF